ncbi:MAG: response regulator transcription factor [Elusimicrobiota bacterium]|nr:MAG: response regulator transcription factor [Elusimicrobiota bacterium]
MTARPIRVLLADDHPLVRLGVQAQLARHPGIRVVAEAADGEQAVRLALALKPDIVLLDVDMPKLGGLDAARRIRKSVPACRVIILSMHEDSVYVRQAVAAGAKGYVQKDAPLDELSKAIETVFRGRSHFSDAASRALLDEVVVAGGRVKDDDAAGLTAREREVLVLVAEGLRSREIAARLKIGVRTVETHRQRLMRKLDVRTTAGLTRYALSAGLVKLR